MNSSSQKTQVVAAVIEQEGRFLLGKRSSNKKSAAGYWCPISGRIEPGETEQDAVVREVFEEVGLKTRAVEKLCEFDTRDKSARIHWWKTEVLSGSAFLKSDEHTEIRWLMLAELSRLQPTFEEDIAVYQKLGKQK